MIFTVKVPSGIDPSGRTALGPPNRPPDTCQATVYRPVHTAVTFHSNLTDRPGFGKDRFDDAVAYARDLPGRIVAAILEADEHRKPAKLGVAAKDVGLNRNRHTKRPVRPTDPRLTVVRFDLRVPGKMIVRLPRAPGEPIMPMPQPQQG